MKLEKLTDEDGNLIIAMKMINGENKEKELTIPRPKITNGGE